MNLIGIYLLHTSNWFNAMTLPSHASSIQPLFACLHIISFVSLLHSGRSKLAINVQYGRNSLQWSQTKADRQTARTRTVFDQKLFSEFVLVVVFFIATVVTLYCCL